jgi:hypothetical protein
MPRVKRFFQIPNAQKASDDGYAIENSQNTGLDEHGSASPFSLIVAEKAQKCQAKSAYSFAVSSFLG